MSTDANGLFVGAYHDRGGIPSKIVETNQQIEIEGDEYYICREAYNSPKKFSYNNKSNKEILDDLYQNFSCKLVQSAMNAGDFIVCKLVVLDNSKHNRRGTVKQIVNEMQGEKACRVENGSSSMKDGGGISPHENYWNDLQKWEKIHFLDDHADELKIRRGSQQLDKYAIVEFKQLPQNLRVAIRTHFYAPKYSDGGTTYGQELSGKEVKKFYSDVEENSFLDFVRDDDQYVLKKVDVQKIIDRDGTLQDFINSEYDKVDVDWDNSLPILIGNTDYDKSVVLDGYHRVKRNLLNNTPKITALVIENPEAFPTWAKGGSLIYHVTNCDLKRDANTPMHFGTLKQAENRCEALNYGNDAQYYVCEINPDWKVLETSDLVANKFAKNPPKKFEYNAIKYPNQVEGEGFSYVIFGDADVKPFEKGGTAYDKWQSGREKVTETEVLGEVAKPFHNLAKGIDSFTGGRSERFTDPIGFKLKKMRRKKSKGGNLPTVSPTYRDGGGIEAVNLKIIPQATATYKGKKGLFPLVKVVTKNSSENYYTGKDEKSVKALQSDFDKLKNKSESELQELFEKHGFEYDNYAKGGALSNSKQNRIAKLKNAISENKKDIADLQKELSSLNKSDSDYEEEVKDINELINDSKKKIRELENTLGKITTEEKYAKGGGIEISEVYEVDGKDYLFSTPLQNAKGEYTGWEAYEVVYDVIDGEKHLNYEKTKRKKRQYFTNEVKRKKVDDYFAEGGEIKVTRYKIMQLSGMSAKIWDKEYRDYIDQDDVSTTRLYELYDICTIKAIEQMIKDKELPTDFTIKDYKRLLTSSGYAEGGSIYANNSFGGNRDLFDKEISLEKTRQIAKEVVEEFNKNLHRETWLEKGSIFSLNEEIEQGSFDLDIILKDGNVDEYYGGSYAIMKNGDVVNFAVSTNPIAYNYKTKDIYAKGGSLTYKNDIYYLLYEYDKNGRLVANSPKAVSVETTMNDWEHYQSETDLYEVITYPSNRKKTEHPTKIELWLGERKIEEYILSTMREKGGASFINRNIRIAFYEKDKGKPFSTEYYDDEEEALERYQKILKEFESNPDDSVQVRYETMLEKGGKLAKGGKLKVGDTVDWHGNKHKVEEIHWDKSKIGEGDGYGTMVLLSNGQWVGIAEVTSKMAKGGEIKTKYYNGALAFLNW
jgi:hypothetical protein